MTQRVMSIMVANDDPITWDEVIQSWNKILASEGLEVVTPFKTVLRHVEPLHYPVRRVGWLVWLKPIAKL